MPVSIGTDWALPSPVDLQAEGFDKWRAASRKLRRSRSSSSIPSRSPNASAFAPGISKRGRGTQSSENPRPRQRIRFGESGGLSGEIGSETSRPSLEEEEEEPKSGIHEAPLVHRGGDLSESDTEATDYNSEEDETPEENLERYKAKCDIHVWASKRRMYEEEKNSRTLQN